MKKFASYVLPVSLIIGVAVLGCMRLRRQFASGDNIVLYFDAAIIALYLLWLAYETTVSRNDATQDKTAADYGTRELYGAGQFMTILSALYFKPVWTVPGIAHLAGGIIFISGVAFRVWAIRTLGRYYSHKVRTIDGHRIVDTGPYAWLRHPAYSGMLTAHAGVTLIYFNCVTLAIYALMLVPAVVLRIIIEEKTLMTIPGYGSFAAKRKRIIPGVW